MSTVPCVACRRVIDVEPPGCPTCGAVSFGRSRIDRRLTLERVLLVSMGIALGAVPSMRPRGPDREPVPPPLSVVVPVTQMEPGQRALRESLQRAFADARRRGIQVVSLEDLASTPQTFDGKTIALAGQCLMVGIPQTTSFPLVISPGFQVEPRVRISCPASVAAACESACKQRQITIAIGQWHHIAPPLDREAPWVLNVESVECIGHYTRQVPFRVDQILKIESEP